MQSKFCKGCEKKIKINTFCKIPFGEKYFEFEDGYYCEKCAEIKVKKKRSKL